MDRLNEYIFNIFQLLHTCQVKGLIKKPVKYKINRYDKKVINQIYDVYKIYRWKITRKQFRNMCINYSVSSGINIVKSGNDICVLIEKTNNK